MASEQTYEGLTSVMRELFRDPALNATPELTARDVKGWDSLAHIRFVLQVEKAFGIKFATTEISRFKNVGELADMIERKKQA
ncbi:acyl carrier protein [Bosea sp. NPDC055594]|jgi:acyl carrier protein